MIACVCGWWHHPDRCPADPDQVDRLDAAGLVDAGVRVLDGSVRGWKVQP